LECILGKLKCLLPLEGVGEGRIIFTAACHM
jgi:hypothetical protein